MILVVALNPALDITHHVAGVEWAGVNRPFAVHASPGGKGLNVARILRALGSRDDVCLMGLSGGHTGSVLAAAVSAADIPAVFTEIAGETRRTFAVLDSHSGDTAIFNEPGPVVTGAEFAAFLDCFAEALPSSSAVVLSGSLPPGLAADTYAGLIALAAQAGVPTLLDTSGEALMVGAAAGPAIVKPNATELLAAVGRSDLAAGTGDRAAVQAAADAALELRDRGADAVVVTLGADGLLAVTAEGMWQAGSTPISGNPTGAGDAVAAGLARGLVFGYSWATLLSHAVALGAAAVAAPIAGQFTEADYDRALAEVEISSWEASECP